MERIFEISRNIILLITFSLLIIPASVILMISDIREESEQIKKYSGKFV